MTTAYTSLLGLALPVTGELSGTWGDTVNTAITSLLDTAVAGTTSITTDADITLSTTTGASNQARQSIILWNPASGTVTRNITAPAQSKLYTVINASGGTQSIVIRGAGPTTGVTIAKGESAQVAWNGSDFVKVGSSGGAITFTDLTVTGNTILGDAAADTLTVNATSTFAAPVNFTGQVKLPSTGRSAAAALTPTNPAFLYGVASTYTDTTSSGTLAPVASFYGLAQPTLSTSNVTTYTNAATLYIANAPTTGGSATITNPYSLYIAAGASYLGGLVTATGFAGPLNGTVGATTATTGAFTTLTTSSTTTLSGGTANGVAYLNGSKVLTTGSALTFDGNQLAIKSGGTFQPLKVSGYGGSIDTYFYVDTAYWAYGDATGLGGNAFGGNKTSNYLFWQINGSEQMRLTSTGLGIGTSSPAYKLDVAGPVNLQGTSTFPATGLMHRSGDNQLKVIGGSAGISFAAQSGASTYGMFDSSGNLGLGVTPSAWGASYRAFEFGGGGSALFSGTSTAAQTYLTSNAYFNGSNWAYKNTNAASNYEQLSGAHAWYTASSGTAGNAISFTQAMTLDAGGNLLVGTTSSYFGATGRGTIELNGSSDSIFGMKAGGTVYGYLYSSASEFRVGNITANPLTFYTNNTERARIDSSGNLLVGATSNPLGARLFGDGGTSTNAVGAYSQGSGGNVAFYGRVDSTSNYLALWSYSGSAVGSITTNGSLTLYNTTSDQRLKENIQDADSASTLIDALQVRQYDWKSDGLHQRYGFVAQELITVAPEAVHAPADPNEMMAVDYSKLVPLLVKEIQSLRARVAQLESKP